MARYSWQYLEKDWQVAMNERVCYCGAHVRGPDSLPNGTYCGNDGECPIKNPCSCGHEDCPGLNQLNNKLRNESGNITIDSRLVSFFYELLRDHLPAGKVEKIVRNSENESNIQYTNGFLAQYALNLANRLK